MTLAALLSQRKSHIVGRWLELLYASYPPETRIFLKKEKDRFDNPVGYRISQGVKGLYEALLQERAVEDIAACLDEIIRIRAIQDFSPSQALAFIFLLKNVIREELAPELEEGSLAEEVWEMESRIDGLALLGFDVYMRRREKLYELRIDEVKNRVSGLLRRTGITVINP